MELESIYVHDLEIGSQTNNNELLMMVKYPIGKT